MKVTPSKGQLLSFDFNFLFLSFLILLFSCNVLLSKNIESIGFYYGNSPIPNEFKAFDTLVVEPSSVNIRHEILKSRLWAYVSLGEIDKNRSYLSKIPHSWKKGRNTEWNSVIIDQSIPEWTTFFCNEVIEPLVKQGYQGIFIDTLDSYQRIIKSPQEQKKQELGMIRIINEIHQRYPSLKILLNRGFEILPFVYHAIDGVCAESLFQRWNQSKKQYEHVNNDDFQWLYNQLTTIQKNYKLPIVVIDYLPAKEQKQRLRVAEKIKNLGFIPYISDAKLETVGTGVFQVFPRRILLLYDGREFPQLSRLSVLNTLSMPLHYKGYLLEYLDMNHLVSLNIQHDKYAGVILWNFRGEQKQATLLEQHIQHIVQENVPLLILGDFGFELSSKTLDLLQLTLIPNHSVHPTIFDRNTTIVDFETQANLGIERPLMIQGKGKSFLRWGDKNSYGDGVFVSSWGGFALSPFVVQNYDEIETSRWIIHPLKFLDIALQLENFPVPDVTTHHGKRIAFSHIDGDGFVSQTEYGNKPLAAEVIRKEILEQYHLPTTVSIIEGEISPSGLYPNLSQRAIDEAKKIYQLNHVEAATHTYSHPFYWRKVTTSHTNDDRATIYGYNLPLKNYTYSHEREILGSKSFIETHLLPSHKKVNVLLWSGDCDPDEKALQIAKNANLLAMNGGETTIRKSHPTWTEIAPLGKPENNEYQVYAPNQNENVYTQLWSQNFNGYEKVIETFEMTNKPYRFKPIDIYFHFYSATKKSSLNALKKVFSYVMTQDITPLYASEYIKKVHNYSQSLITKDDNFWYLHYLDDNSEFRINQLQGFPDLEKSKNIIGYTDHEEVRYIHTIGSSAKLALKNSPPTQPFVESANGTFSHFQRLENGLTFTLASHTYPLVTIANAKNCHITSITSIKTTMQSNKVTLTSRELLPMTITLVCPQQSH